MYIPVAINNVCTCLYNLLSCLYLSVQLTFMQQNRFISRYSEQNTTQNVSYSLETCFCLVHSVIILASLFPRAQCMNWLPAITSIGHRVSESSWAVLTVTVPLSRHAWDTENDYSEACWTSLLLGVILSSCVQFVHMVLWPCVRTTLTSWRLINLSNMSGSNFARSSWVPARDKLPGNQSPAKCHIMW